MQTGERQHLWQEEQRPMRNNSLLYYAILLFLLIAVLPSISKADTLDSIVAQTQSSDPEVRAAAFYSLLPYLSQQPLDPRAFNAAVQLLLLETNSSDPVDSDGEYFSDLVTAVASIDDPSTIPVLIGVIGTGNMVPRKLAQYGTASLDQVIARSTDQDWLVRKCVMITLTNMLSPANLSLVSDQNSLQKIAETLSQGVLDSDPYVSESALVGLQLLPASKNPADVNGDGVVNCLDLELVKASFGKKTGQYLFNPRADVNGDGIVNILDLSIVARQLPAGTVCK
jgi:hypothetical protein